MQWLVRNKALPRRGLWPAVGLTGHTRAAWLGAVLIGLLTACQAVGHSMDASELFSPSVVAVLHSIQNGDAAGARYSLSHGADLNVQGKEGVTPLQWLIYQTQDKRAVQRALTLGADPNFKDGAGDSAVNTLARAKDPEWLRLILDAGGNPNAIGRRGQPALFAAISEDRWDNVRLLVARGADIELADEAKTTSVHYAAYLNKYQMVHWLIEQGAQVETYSATGSSLAWRVYERVSIMAQQSPEYPWLRCSSNCGIKVCSSRRALRRRCAHSGKKATRRNLTTHLNLFVTLLLRFVLRFFGAGHFPAPHIHALATNVFHKT